jgi:hypothetical protein
MTSESAQLSREVYGVTGARGAGKDTFTRMVNERTERPFAVLPFAGPLKRMVLEVFPITERCLHDPLLKERLFPEPIVMDEYLAQMRAATGIYVLPRGLLADSPRRLMQYFGTDYVRSVQDDFWIRRFEESIAGCERVMVPDTRFPNEAKFLAEISAKVIRIKRDDEPVADARSQHASEIYWRQIPADLIVTNVTGIPDSMATVAELVAQGRFRDAVRASCTNWEPSAAEAGK